jgi:hypothetical protein
MEREDIDVEMMIMWTRQTITRWSRTWQERTLMWEVMMM